MEHHNNTEQQSDLLDFTELLKTIISRWRWFATSVVICCTVGCVAYLFMKSKYQVNANIILSENNGIGALLANSEMGGMASLFGANASSEDEVDILTSHTNLAQAVKDLNINIRYFDHPFPLCNTFLYKKSPIALIPDPTSINVDTLETTLYFKVKTNAEGLSNISVKAKGDLIFSAEDCKLPKLIKTTYGSFSISPTEYAKPGKSYCTKVEVLSPGDAAEDLRKELNIELARKRSQIINLSIITPSKDFGRDLLNKIVSVYSAQSIADQMESAEPTRQFFVERLNQMRNQLDSAEMVITGFKKKDGIVQLEEDAKMRMEKLAEIEEKMLQQKLALKLAEVSADIISNAVKTNSLIPDISEKGDAKDYNALMLQRMRLEQSASKDNPSLKRLNEQIAVLKTNMLETANTKLNSERELYQGLVNLYNNAKGETGQIPSLELEYRDKLLNREIQEQIYVFMLTKQEENSMLMENIQARTKIVDNAYVINKDQKVDLKFMLIFCFVLGLFIPILWIYFKSKFIDN